MLGPKDHWATIKEAVGIRRFIVGSTITAILAALQFLSGVPYMNWISSIPTYAIAAVAAAALLFWWLLDYATNLRKECEPKVRIYLSVFLHPPEANKGLRTVRINVENISKCTLKNCSVREFEFVNRHGHRSQMQRYFRLNKDTHADMSKHAYRYTFDLQGQGSNEIIDIAQLDETNDDSRVVMLYATEPTAPTLNAIVRDCFPHRLTILMTSDNLLIAERRTFDLKISDFGVLQIEPVGQSPGHT